MSERDSYNPGEFCWVDLATPDVEASARFYGELMGWEFESVPIGGGSDAEYGFFTRGGKQVCGAGSLMSDDQPPAWSSYVSVADADASAAKVNDAGGTVIMGPLDLPNDSGRMAVCHDPEGAVVSIFQQKEHHGAQLVNEVGTWTWNQLGTRDPDAAKSFYGDVFGWRLEQAEDAPPDLPYYMWQVDGQRWEEGLAGLQVLGEETPAEVPPHWMVYFAVGDAAAAIETVNGAGGTTVAGPIDIPVGKLAVFADPQGAGFAIIEPDYPDER